MLGIFSYAEIYDLIAEAGNIVTLLTPGVISPEANLLGIRAETAYTERQLIAYIVTPESQQNSAIAVQGGGTRDGGYDCYIAGADLERKSVKRSDFSAGTRIQFDGELYNINYAFPLQSRGVTVIHQVALSPIQ